LLISTQKNKSAPYGALIFLRVDIVRKSWNQLEEYILQWGQVIQDMEAVVSNQGNT
jgi:hypothetical protein